MPITFRPAVKNKVGTLIGIAGGPGSGKTLSALMLATGLQGTVKPFALIDTESGRALHYAPKPGREPDFRTTFRFDHAELHPPFRSLAYRDAIKDAIASGYRVIVIDSMSHEHEGEGGFLDAVEEEIERLSHGDARRQDNMNMAALIKPKKDRKRMVHAMLQSGNVHIIMCFRAAPKIEIVKEANDRGVMKTVIRPKRGLNSDHDGWTPICDERFPFEMTAYGMLYAKAPGAFSWIKNIGGELAEALPDGGVIDIQSGVRLAEWAGSGSDAPPPPPKSVEAWVEEISLSETEEQARTVGREAWKALSGSDRDRVKAAVDEVCAAIRRSDAEASEGDL